MGAFEGQFLICSTSSQTLCLTSISLRPSTARKGAFVAMHMAIEARSGNATVLPAQLPAVDECCTITCAGVTPAVRTPHKAFGACTFLVLLC